MILMLSSHSPFFAALQRARLPPPLTLSQSSKYISHISKTLAGYLLYPNCQTGLAFLDLCKQTRRPPANAAVSIIFTFTLSLALQQIYYIQFYIDLLNRFTTSHSIRKAVLFSFLKVPVSIGIKKLLMRNLCTSHQLCCEPKTTLENKVY